MIGDLSLVKSAMLIGKTTPHFRCLHIASLTTFIKRILYCIVTAMLFMLLAAECQGRLLPNIISAASSQWQQIFDSRCND